MGQIIEFRDDIKTGDENDDKYFRFVGQDWVWICPSKEEKKLHPRDIFLNTIKEATGGTWTGEGYQTRVESKDRDWRLCCDVNACIPEMRYILLLTMFMPKILSVPGWCYGYELVKRPTVVPSFRHD